MTQANRGSISGTEAASLWGARAGERLAAAEVYPELIARLAISLAADVSEPAFGSVSLFDRVSLVGDQIAIEDLPRILTDREQACVPAARVMLDVFGKGYQE